VWSSKSLHESGGLSALAEPQQQHHRYGVFDVVYHFSKAAALIQDPAQRLLIAKLNLQAAIKAKNSMGAHSSLCTGETLPLTHRLTLSSSFFTQRTRWRARWPPKG